MKFGQTFTNFTVEEFETLLVDPIWLFRDWLKFPSPSAAFGLPLSFASSLVSIIKSANISTIRFFDEN